MLENQFPLCSWDANLFGIEDGEESLKGEYPIQGDIIPEMEYFFAALSEGFSECH